MTTTTTARLIKKQDRTATSQLQAHLFQQAEAKRLQDEKFVEEAKDRGYKAMLVLHNGAWYKIMARTAGMIVFPLSHELPLKQLGFSAFRNAAEAKKRGHLIPRNVLFSKAEI